MADIIDFPSKLETKKVEQNRPNNSLRKTLAIGSVALGLGTLVYLETQPASLPSIPGENQPHKLYTVKNGDTIWNIADRAYPEHDIREVYPRLEEQLSETARENHILEPGQRLVLPVDADIGKMVNPDQPPKK